MFKNYLKVAFRHLARNKFHALLNIAGLSAGITVSMLIGLWVYDELSFDRYHRNYDHIAQVMQDQTFNGHIVTRTAIPIPLEAELRSSYGNDFRYLVLSSFTWSHILTFGDKQFLERGNFMGAEAPEMLTLKMLSGSRDGLKGSGSLLLSRTVAYALFGNGNALGQIVKLDNKMPMKVTGVYEDLPANTTFSYLSFIAPWEAYYAYDTSIRKSISKWEDNSYRLFVQLSDHADGARVSSLIANVKADKTSKPNSQNRPKLFLQPMSRWHLYSEFKDGVNVGGKITFVWLFGAIGIFVLLLACINFMNLSTARSERLAREVGIRKAIGSLRAQLILQFFSESLVVTLLSFVVSIELTLLFLPFFNGIADKKMAILWDNPVFWSIGLGFALITGLIAGSYPALYLSSFRPVKVLKGTFKMSRMAGLPRKILVVFQFTVSIILIIGTIVVFRQIQFAKDRPIGYDQNGLIAIHMNTRDLHNHFEAVKNDLLASKTVTQVAESTSPTTGVYDNISGLTWEGKAPNMIDQFATVGVTYDYGKALGWQFLDGRDFSRNFLTDSNALVLNEAAVKYMGLHDPIGKKIIVDHECTVIGVIKDMVMESPYQPARPTLFNLDFKSGAILNIRLRPGTSEKKALDAVEQICHKYAPAEPFDYKFVDEEYAKKFSDEVHVGKLSVFFTILAIFISCLGLFGMASFMAEQRIREIGIRKTLGASVFSLWSLLSGDFLRLILISICIATPVAYYFMYKWLGNYTYRIGISWWIFVLTGVGSLTITLLTISYQAIRAALMSPVKSLRSE